MDIQMSEKILRLDMSIKTHHKDETNVRLVYHRVSSGCRAINSNVFVFFYLLKKAVSKQFFFSSSNTVSFSADGESQVIRLFKTIEKGSL